MNQSNPEEGGEVVPKAPPPEMRIVREGDATATPRLLTLMNGDLLRQGRHVATLSEVEEAFVLHAPFESERRLVWDAFLVYRQLVGKHLPSARYWVNGGFVTHKTWAAPRDIDVCVVAQADELAVVDEAIDHLFTDPGPPRAQPMGELVDGFLIVSGARDHVLYWSELWTRVRLEDGTADPDRRKGYLEVRD